MCGLGAILRTDGGPIDEAWLGVLSRRIGYRGPDGMGRFLDRSKHGARVALVHHRLSILDHAGGGQPMTLATGDDLITVVFNGCIYNHRDLRRELERRGHAFSSDHSDTEVLLHGHREWGPALPDHLEGMYAYVIWDRASGAIACARDPFGEKPLYRAERDGTLIVASDARAVAEVANLIAPGPLIDDDPAWLAGYLQLGYGPSGTTGYRGVRAVAPVGPPAPQPSPDDASPNGRDLLDAIESALDAAVAARLEADVPLGGFLSGGVDSSLIAHFARRHLDEFRTFSVRMPDARYDESAHAERVARHLGTHHVTLEVSPDPADDLTRLIQRLGQPLGDSSLLPTAWVTRAAREHVTVALAGDGADELFLGYERYLAARTLARRHRALACLPRRLGRRRHPKSRLHKAGRLGAMARDFRSSAVLGHEGVGTVVRMGEAVGRDTAGQVLSEGDRVTWTIMAACGRCVFCRIHDLPQKCLSLFKYGHSVSDVPPYFVGTFGEYVYLKPGTGIFKLPADMTDETASPLMCAAATIAAGLDRAGVIPGETVVIQGAGMLGLYAAAFAKAMGAAQVMMVDVLDKRLDVAKRFGADHVVNVDALGQDALVEAVRECTGGLGADLLIEVAGLAAVVETGVKMLRIGGRYLIHGAVYPNDTFTLQSHDVITKCLSLYGLHNYDAKHLQTAMNLVLRTQETYPYSELAGPRFPLTADGVTDALLALEQREGIRPIVEPGP